MSYADVNGVSMYYEEHGSGQPLILLHGGLGSGAVRPAHIVEFYALLGGGLRDANWDGSLRPVARLAILPGHTHYALVAAADLPAAVRPFLDAESREPPPPIGG